VLENKEYRIYDVRQRDADQMNAREKELAARGYGLSVYYYDNINWEGKPIQEEIDVSMKFHWSNDNEKPVISPFSALWKGFIDIEKEGVYLFTLASDDGSWLYLDDRIVVDNGGCHALASVTGSVILGKGKHKITVKYFDNGGGAVFDLTWVPPGGLKEQIPIERLTCKD
jgi:hypothetical protein